MAKSAANRHLVVRQLLASSRLTMPLFDALSKIPADRRVQSDSTVCIEGYPRSGNSWAVFCFRRWNPSAVIAHHAHVPGQMLEAVEADLPTALVIRTPLDAISSYLVFSGGRISPRAAVWAYVRFHSRIGHIRDEIVICEFDEIIATPSILVDRLNVRFGTDFESGPVTEEFRRSVIADLRERADELGADQATQQSAPAEGRDALKQEARELLAQERELSRAQELFEELTGGQGHTDAQSADAARSI